ncbi:MAG: hypothetical protein HQ538_04575 [Parcubacteria group bacterium]|nr:hypothetical protein [Parcubacteria group bacterium]
MKKMEERKVEVKYCDFCEEETAHLNKCAVCKRNMCSKNGMSSHSAYSVEIYRYRDGQRLAKNGSKICKDCAGEKFDGTIQELLDGMMSKIPVIIKV